MHSDILHKFLSVLRLALPIISDKTKESIFKRIIPQNVIDSNDTSTTSSHINNIYVFSQLPISIFMDSIQRSISLSILPNLLNLIDKSTLSPNDMVTYIINLIYLFYVEASHY